jgi:opine dehydrogenase
VESTGGDYNHYYDGITPSVGRLIDALDAERIAVAAGLGVAIEPLPQLFFRMGYTNAAGRDGGTAYDVFQQQRAKPRDQGAGHHRSSLPQRGCALWARCDCAAGIPTPCADAVIDIASIVAARPFSRAGLTRERMGIGGMTAAEVTTLLRTGKAP